MTGRYVMQFCLHAVDTLFSFWVPKHMAGQKVQRALSTWQVWDVKQAGSLDKALLKGPDSVSSYTLPELWNLGDNLSLCLQMMHRFTCTPQQQQQQGLSLLPACAPCSVLLGQQPAQALSPTGNEPFSSFFCMSLCELWLPMRMAGWNVTEPKQAQKQFRTPQCQRAETVSLQWMKYWNNY